MKQELIKVEEKRSAFDIGELLPIGMLIVVLAIGISIGLQILGETRADMIANSYEYNATQAGIIAVAKIPSKLGLVVTVILAAVVIGILFRYMSFGKTN